MFIPHFLLPSDACQPKYILALPHISKTSKFQLLGHKEKHTLSWMCVKGLTQKEALVISNLFSIYLKFLKHRIIQEQAMGQ